MVIWQWLRRKSHLDSGESEQEFPRIQFRPEEERDIRSKVDEVSVMIPWCSTPHLDLTYVVSVVECITVHGIKVLLLSYESDSQPTR
jgi:hypothetical protein